MAHKTNIKTKQNKKQNGLEKPEKLDLFHFSDHLYASCSSGDFFIHRINYHTLSFIAAVCSCLHTTIN